MKNKQFQKIKDFITILIIQLVLTIPFYTANVYGLTISNVQVTKVTASSATIEWDTDNISNGKVRYGNTTVLGFTQRHDNFVQNHTLIVFNGIESETNYFFVVESTDLASNTVVDNNSNNFYTFTTLDITPPHKVTGLMVISVTSTSIFLSWDNVNATDLSHYVVFRNKAPIANTTTNSFNDTNLSSDTEFNYKVSAVDNSNNEDPQSDTVIASTSAIDSIAPIITNIDALPITDTTARVTWLTNENATTIVLYGINKTDKIKSSTDLETNHTIVIDGLVKNVKHIFVVKSCDKSSNCANSSAQSFIAGRDTTAPFANFSIPRYINRRVIDIVGSTEPFSSVTLFVNNLNIPKRSLSSKEVGGSGKFIFSQIQLQQDNVIKIRIVDKSGNKNEKTFDVSIDTEGPIVQLNEIPSITSKTNLTISGTVNEPVTIKVFVDTNVNETAVPSKITGLNATKVEQNSIRLEWNELKDKDFSHYVVYREDASPIAITKPADFNLFIDALVDSGKSYTYQVSAVNIFANEGPKSESITVTTLQGGAILNLKYSPVDIFEDFRKPLIVTNASASFNFGINLNKGDGEYQLKLIFDDRAGNSVLIEKGVLLDTKKPEIKIISPPSGAFIFENVANEVDVIGKTKPNARVHLFVDRTPFSFFNQTLELTGLPNEVQNIPEADLDAKCRFNVAAKSFCRTGADFSIDADSQGNFKFEKVDLTTIFGGAARLKEVPVTEFRDITLEEGKDSKRTTLVVIATDATGQRGVVTQTIAIGTCWSGNQSWDIIPLTQYQSPTFLSTERLREGTETIYFYFNYSYIGRGTSPILTGTTISKACSTRELIDSRFNVSCQIMPSSVPTQQLKISKNEAENTISYSTATLSRFPGMDRFLENDWKSFFKAINKELTFPLRVRITYKHDTDNDGNLETETQTMCEQVSYVIDDTIIDPRRILPDWLLFDAVDFLQDSIKTLTDIQEQINKLIDYVAVGCFASGGAHLALQVYRRWVSFWEERAYSILKLAKGTIGGLDIFAKNPLKPSDPNEKGSCEETIKKIVEKYGSFKLKYVNDFDLNKCFPSVASAWNLEAKTWELMRYSCDRIFGHSAPSRWTETKIDSELTRKAQSIESCEGDEGALGQPLKVESCTELARKNPTFKAAETFGTDAKCTIVSEKNKRSVFLIGKPISDTERLYEIQHISATGGLSGETKYAVKSRQSEFDYLTTQSKSCQEICSTGKQGKIGKAKFSGRDVQIIKDASGSGVIPECIPVNDCTALNAKDEEKKLLITGKDKDGKDVKQEIKYARNWGFTSDCFYDPDKPEFSNPNIVSDSRETRVECCCINTKETTEPPTRFYHPEDKDPATGSFVHESKSVAGQPPQGEISSIESKEDIHYADMKWSYRYSKERFEAKGIDGATHTQYHPHRYIEGRDFPACFGQNHWLYDNPLGFALGQPERVLVIDPSKDYLIAPAQCAHLAGISQRIQFLSNLMSSFSTCLIQVRTTGRGDSNACRELFTQYLCNSIWQVIRLFTDKGCVTTEYGDDPNVQSDKIVDYVRAGFKSVSDSISDLQTGISQEYGNAKLNELLGTGEESIARKLCLAAFGYDWEINIKNLVDAAYTTPFATLVQPITRSREFLTVNPIDLKPKYEYRASWIINPGCDFERYDIYLTCVGRKELDQYPNQINCGAVGAPSIGYTIPLRTTPGFSQCDCIGLSEEKRRQVFTGTRLKQNTLEDKSFHQVIDDNYRYDHLKFVLRPDRKIPANIKPNCFPQGYDDGVFYAPLLEKTARDIFDCRADILSGTFDVGQPIQDGGVFLPCCRKDPNTGAIICGGGAAFATRKGTAEFIDIKINEQNALGRIEDLVFNAGDTLKIDTTIRSVGQNKCLRLILGGETPLVQEVFEGIQQYTVQTPLTLGTRNEIVEPVGIRVQRINLNNQKDVSINVRFWDRDNDGFINIDKGGDEVEIDGVKIKIGDVLGSTLKINEGRSSQVEVSAVNRQIILKKEEAEVAIIAIEVQRDSNGRIIKDKGGEEGVAFVQGTIKIFPPFEIAQTQQQLTKTLILGLYHTSDTPDVFGIAACNFNEPVLTVGGNKQERTVRIKVEQKPIATVLQGPIIRVTNLQSDNKLTPFRKNVDNFVISAIITHSYGIETTQLDCKKPDGSSLTTLTGIPRSNNNYEFYINTNDIDVAGEYNCKLTAKSTHQQARVNSQEIKAEVMCGGDNVYGLCDKDRNCCRNRQCKSDSDKILVGLPCS